MIKIAIFGLFRMINLPPALIIYVEIDHNLSFSQLFNHLRVETKLMMMWSSSLVRCNRISNCLEEILSLLLSLHSDR